MRRIGIISGILAASMGISAIGISSTPLVALAPDEAPRSTSGSRKKQRRVRLIAGGYKAIRSKGAPGKRKSKSNRNTISKRVRRKHRRAA